MIYLLALAVALFVSIPSGFHVQWRNPNDVSLWFSFVLLYWAFMSILMWIVDVTDD